MPKMDFEFYKRLLLGLLIIGAGAIIAALTLLIPVIGISIIGGILGLWVLVLSYKLGNALLRPSVWQTEAIQRPSEYIRRLTREIEPEQGMRKPWFYPGEYILFDDGPLTTERLEEERKEAQENSFPEMRFDLDKIISEAQKNRIPADYGIREMPIGLTSNEAWQLEQEHIARRQTIRWDEIEDESESH